MRKFNTRLFAGLLAVFCCMTALSATAYADGGYYEQSEDGSETPPSSIDSITISTETVRLPEQQGSEALTPDGNLTLIDDILQSAPYASVEEAAENKQFITVQSKNGNYFYIVIDRSGDTENVYFLNLVDEVDLMALMENGGSLLLQGQVRGRCGQHRLRSLQDQYDGVHGKGKGHGKDAGARPDAGHDRQSRQGRRRKEVRQRSCCDCAAAPDGGRRRAVLVQAP